MRNWLQKVFCHRLKNKVRFACSFLWRCHDKSFLDKVSDESTLATMKLSLHFLFLLFLYLVRPSMGATPLHQAVRAHDIATVREIVETTIGTALDIATDEGVTALHLAAAIEGGCQEFWTNDKRLRVVAHNFLTILDWDALGAKQ